MSELREKLAEALRTCRVDDGAPVRLLSESDVFHVSHMLLPVVEQEIAAERQRFLARVGTFPAGITGMGQEYLNRAKLLAAMTEESK